MNASPKVAVVILNWNGRKFLQQFLPSVLLSADSNAEIIVADNASSDDSIAFLKENYPTVRVLCLERNFGFAKGYNEALKQIEADYYVILNSDVEVSPGWLSPMVNLLESNHQIAACQPKLLSYDRRNEFEYAGGAGGWLDKYGYPFVKGRIFDINEEDHGQYDASEPIFWASGAALFIRARIFHEMNGFDEFFFAHQEEIDLCWRIQLSGFMIYSCPASVVYHLGGGTLSSENSFKTFLNFRNNRIMLSKNLPFSKKLWVVPVRSFLDAISAWKGLLSGHPGYFWAIIKARFAFLGWWLFHRRKSPYPISRKGRLYGYLQKNVVLERFLRKKKFFSDIVGKSS